MIRVGGKGVRRITVESLSLDLKFGFMGQG